MTQKSHMFAEMQRCGMARYSWNGPWTHTKGIYLFIKDVTEVAAACVSVMSGTGTFLQYTLQVPAKSCILSSRSFLGKYSTGMDLMNFSGTMLHKFYVRRKYT